LTKYKFIRYSYRDKINIKFFYAFSARALNLTNFLLRGGAGHDNIFRSSIIDGIGVGGRIRT
jgi:hypothetical protein